MINENGQQLCELCVVSRCSAFTEALRVSQLNFFVLCQTAFSAPHSLSSYQLTAHTPHSFSYTPVSHHAPGHSRDPSHTSLMEGSALWAMTNTQNFDGSSYFQSCNSQSGVCMCRFRVGESHPHVSHLAV